MRRSGLDKGIVNIDANYINYIQSNPKLVLSAEGIVQPHDPVGDKHSTILQPLLSQRPVVQPKWVLLLPWVQGGAVPHLSDLQVPE